MSVSAALLANEAGAHAPGFPVATGLIILPAVGALAVLLVPRLREELFKPVALLFATGTAALSIYALAAFDRHDAGYQFEVNRSWISEFGISWHLGIDGISLFLVVLTGILFPIAILATDPHHDPKRYYAWLLTLQAGCLGVFMALDLFLFFVMFEIVLVPMYFLIGGWGYANRVYAALKFFLFTMFGSALMLVGIVTLAYLDRDALQDQNRAEAQEIVAESRQEDPAGPSGEQADEVQRLQEDVPLDFDLVEIAEGRRVLDDSSGSAPWDWSAARWLFVAFAIAFAVKVPLFPLHTWLPDAHTEAPTAGSVILAGVLLKLGTYGLLRFGVYLFPDAAHFFAPGLVTLGVIGIIYGAVVATMQRDLKRLVAYSSVAHLGFIVLGTFAMTRQGIEGGLLQNVNHGLSTGALFILVGYISDRRHTREISALKGLQKVAPIFAAVFTLVMLSSIGVPGLNGFVGEFLTLIGAFPVFRWWTVIAAAGVILAALYLLWAYQRVFHGEPDEANSEFAELRWKEGLVLAPLLGLIVFLGVYPKPVLDRMEPAVDRLITHIEDNSDFTEPAVASEGPRAVASASGEGEGADAEAHE